MEIKKEILYSPVVIACTANNVEDIQQKCLDAGMDDIITKPCAKEFLIAKVKHWIKNIKVIPRENDQHTVLFANTLVKVNVIK